MGIGARFLWVKVATSNEDIKSRITYSETLHGLNDQGLEVYIQSELDAVRMGANTFDDSAIELILRVATSLATLPAAGKYALLGAHDRQFGKYYFGSGRFSKFIFFQDFPSSLVSAIL